jgi:hypothetical protein
MNAPGMDSIYLPGAGFFRTLEVFTSVSNLALADGKTKLEARG